MTDAQTRHRAPSAGRRLDEEIERLVLTLPGVRSARAETGPDERLDVLEVVLGDESGRHRVTRAIQSVLLIYLDLAIDDGQIVVSPSADGGPPTWSRNASRDAAVSGAGPGEPVSHGTAAPGRDVRRLPSPSGRGACRLVRYAVRGDAAPGVEVVVTVERGGERFDAAVRADDFASLTPAIFAQAAVDAAGRAVPPGEATDGADPRFEFGEVERIEVFGRPHLAVSVSRSPADGTPAAATGFAELGDDFPRAAVVAVLDGVRRLRVGSPRPDGGRIPSDASSLQTPDRPQ